HLNKDWLPGGFLGVDVFFVISGYLITSILLSEIRDQSFSMLKFWARRVRRIFPALLTVVLTTLAFTYLVVYLPDQYRIGQQAVAALLSYANVFFWAETGDYWGVAAEKSPFLHAWSLAVEEQFYVFFPILLVATQRVARSMTSRAILILTLASFVLYVWGVINYPSATFYLMPTRIWELGVGALVASFHQQIKTFESFNRILPFFGLLCITASYFVFDVIGYGAFLAVLGTALILYNTIRTGVSELLSWPALVHIGKLSYSNYLWPLVFLAKRMGVFSKKSEIIVLVAGIYILSLITYWGIEQPTRRSSKVVPRTLLVWTGVLLVAMFMGYRQRYCKNDFFCSVNLFRDGIHTTAKRLR
ncbi:acyltransferase, partial [Rubripirellula sp.]|nr:acyltransferase [Rubripirellula sp.]